MKPWKTLARQKVFQQGKFLTLEIHTLELPDGQIIRDWPWVITPDFVNVMAETDGGRFLCFRQTKYAVAGVSLAPVGGYIDPGETPDAAARRELLEETGYRAEEWLPLGTYAVDANRGAGKAHFFLARRARCVALPHKDDLEEQELVPLSRSELEQALAQGEFKVLPWAALIAIGLLRTADAAG